MVRPYLEVKRENEKLLLEEIREKRTMLTALPPRCTLEHSWRCNYRCKKCSYSSLARGEDFSATGFSEWEWEDFERIAEELFPTMRYTESTLLGEPFLSPQFPRMMEIYRRYGVYYRPTTNGSLLTEEKVHRIEGVVDWLKCSFDAHNDELYRRLYLNGHFAQVVKNLKYFSSARRTMHPYPWFRVGLVLMRSNLNYLREYADFVFQELGVDDMEVMALNYANEPMTDEFYWDIPEEVNRRLEELIEHCLKKGYRLRLPFCRIPDKDGSWIDGQSSRDRSLALAADQPVAERSVLPDFSEEVLSGDIFGNREQLEKGYVWSNDMRVSTISAKDGTPIGVCEFFTRPFFKPPTREKDGKDWIKVESCGSCSTFVFGNLKEQSFRELYNSAMMQKVRAFMYRKAALPREEWMFPCRHCLCVEPIYCYASNGQPNVGLRFFAEDDLYFPPGTQHSLLRSFQGKKIVFFGTGSGARRLVRYFPLPIDYYVDNDSRKWGTSFLHAMVENPEKLRGEDKEKLVVIVANQFYPEVSVQLQKMDLKPEEHFYNGLKYFFVQ